MLEVKPHHFAASCVYAALHQQNTEFSCEHSIWCKTLEEESGLREIDIIDHARKIVQHVSEEPETASKRRLVAAKKKHSNEKNFKNVASLPLPSF
jgi:hypothetical protein